MMLKLKCFDPLEINKMFVTTTRYHDKIVKRYLNFKTNKKIENRENHNKRINSEFIMCYLSKII